jgi:hypothetical protein
MSLMHRFIRFIKKVVALSGSPLLLSVPGRLPGPIQVPGSLFSVVDGQVLEDEMRCSGKRLGPEAKAQFDESVGDILSRIPDRVHHARERLQVLAQSPPLDTSSSVHVNSAVAHALAGNLHAAQEAITVASNAAQGLISYDVSATTLRETIRDNQAEIRARNKKYSGE